MEKEFISIPRDFRSLNDLKDLEKNYDFYSRLFNELKSYNNHYLNSYIMTSLQVLKEIPKKNWDKYMLMERGQIITCDDDFKDRTINNLNDSDDYYRKQHWIINHTNKTVCLVEFKSLVTTGKKCITTDFYRARYVDIEYKVDTKKGILKCEVKSEMDASYHVGGAWINGRERGYWIPHCGGQSIDYTLRMSDIFTFCTKTNKLIEYDFKYHNLKQDIE
jgi:hypothetical protein